MVFFARGRRTHHLITFPLRWGGVWDLLLGWGRLVLAREGSSQLGQSLLVGGHAHSEGLEVVQLVGQTNSMTVEEDEVARLLANLVHLKHTLLEHGLLELHEEVLAETHGPSPTHSIGVAGVLVHETIDLRDLALHNLAVLVLLQHRDLLVGEDGRNGVSTEAEALGLHGRDVGSGSNGGHEVTQGGQVLALALGHVVVQLARGSDGVGLEGKVVVSDLLVIALDGGEKLVGSGLNTLGDLHEHTLFHALQVCLSTLGNTLGSGLTLHDGLHNTPIHVLLESSSLLGDQRQLLLVGGLLVADDTSQHLETALDLLGVGHNNVTQLLQTGVEVLLGISDVGSSIGLVLGDGSGRLLVVVGSLQLHRGELPIHLLGGTGQVHGSLNRVGSSLVADLADLSVEELLKSLHLVVCGTLVLVEQETDLATSLLRLGGVVVHQTHDASQLCLSAAVDADLLGLVIQDHARDDLHITQETLLLGLDGGSEGGHGGGEGLAGIFDLSGGLGACSIDVLHGLGETRVSEGSLLGDGVVNLGDRASELLLHLGAGLGQSVVHLPELVIGLFLGIGEIALDGLESLLVASSGSSISSRDVSGGLLLGVRDLLGEGSQVSGHEGLNILGLLRESSTVRIDPGVGLLDLGTSLGLEGEQGALHALDGVIQSALGLKLLELDLGSDSLARLGIGLGGGSLLGLSVGELLLHGLDGVGEVRLGLLGSSTHSEEHLLLHGSTGLLGLETQALDLTLGPVGQLGDLRGDTHVEGSLGLGVHVLQLLLGSHHAGLTLVDGITDRLVQLGLVGGHDGSKVLATLLALDSIGTHDASEVVNLLLELLVVGDNGGVKLAQTVGEVGLSLAEGVLEVHLGNSGLLGQHLGCVGAVLLHGGADSIELGGELGRHGSEASIGGSLVLVDQVLQVLVLLEVLGIAIVADLHHALHLSLNIGVNLSLCQPVLLHNTRELGDAGIGLSDLLVDSSTELQDLALELGGCGIHTVLGLLLGSSDVGDSLLEALVVQRSESVHGSSHLGGGSLEGSIGVSAVLSHLGADTIEVSSSLGHDNLQLVVSHLPDCLILILQLLGELGAPSLSLGSSVGHLVVELVDRRLEGLAGSLSVLLNLSSVDGNILLGIVDAGVHGRLQSSHGLLLSLHLSLQLLRSLLLVGADHLTKGLGASLVGLVALVSQRSSCGKLSLHEGHGLVQIVLSLLGIHSHLVEECLLHLGASGLVKGEVTCHLSTHCGDIALASSLLGSDLLLDIREIVDKAHAAVRSIGEDGARLLHILRIHRGRALCRTFGVCLEAQGIHGRQDSLAVSGIAISCDVHHRAADSKAAQERKGDTRAGHLLVHCFQ